MYKNYTININKLIFIIIYASKIQMTDLTTQEIRYWSMDLYLTNKLIWWCDYGRKLQTNLYYLKYIIRNVVNMYIT